MGAALSDGAPVVDTLAPNPILCGSYQGEDLWNVLRRRAPHDSKIHHELIMDEFVAQSGDFFPGALGMSCDKL